MARHCAYWKLLFHTNAALPLSFWHCHIVSPLSMLLCHYDTALTLSCYFGSVMLYCRCHACCFTLYNAAFSPSCYLATVMLLCFSLATLPSSCSLPVSGRFASVMLLCLCNSALPLPCYFATVISMSLCFCHAALPLLRCFALLLSSCYIQCHYVDICILVHIKCSHPHAVYGYAMCWRRCCVLVLLLPCTVCCWLGCVALLRHWVAVCFVCLAFFVVWGSVPTPQTFSPIHSGFIVFSYHCDDAWLACLPPIRGTAFRYHSAVCLVCLWYFVVLGSDYVSTLQ